jgi:hypothetical protein
MYLMSMHLMGVYLMGVHLLQGVHLPGELWIISLVNDWCAKFTRTRIRLALNSHSNSLPRSIPLYGFSKHFQETEAFQMAPTKSVTEIQMRGPPSRRLTTEDGKWLSSEVLIDHRTAVCERLVTESISLPSHSLIP